MGAIIDAGALARLETRDRARRRATARSCASTAAGPRRPPATSAATGSRRPSSITSRPSSSCAREELFGPVLSIVRVPNLHAALALEHASPYGNATSVFTQSGAVARAGQRRSARAA